MVVEERRHDFILLSLDPGVSCYSASDLSSMTLRNRCHNIFTHREEAVQW